MLRDVMFVKLCAAFNFAACKLNVCRCHGCEMICWLTSKLIESIFRRLSDWLVDVATSINSHASPWFWFRRLGLPPGHNVDGILFDDACVTIIARPIDILICPFDSDFPPKYHAKCYTFIPDTDSILQSVSPGGMLVYPHVAPHVVWNVRNIRKGRFLIEWHNITIIWHFICILESLECNIYAKFSYLRTLNHET